MSKDNLIQFPAKRSSNLLTAACWVVLLAVCGGLAFSAVGVFSNIASEMSRIIPTDQQIYEIPDDKFHYR